MNELVLDPKYYEMEWDQLEETEEWNPNDLEVEMNMAERAHLEEEVRKARCLGVTVFETNF